MGVPGSVNALLAAAPAKYRVERSLRFNSSDSAYLSRTPASAGNRKTWTWSGWVKRSGLGTYQRVFNARNPGVAADYIRFNTNDTLEIYLGATLITSQVFRDPSSWYHIALAVDTTQATASDRVKLYVNGTQITAFSTTNYPSQNADTLFNAALIHTIGTGDGTTEYFSGYLADPHLIDGQALTPSSFTEVSATTGQLIPKAYTGSFGTNGFWLKFSDNSAATATTLGKDYSGNSNNWSPTNLSVTAGAGNDSLVDTPTSFGTDTGVGNEVKGNYCIGNWLNQSNLDILKDGNLHWRVDNTRVVTGTHAMSSGKWYWEATVDAIVSLLEIGIVGTQVSFSAENNTAPGTYSSGFAYRSNATKINNNSATSYGASFAAGDLIGVAFDADAGTITFYKNGSTQGTAFTGITSASYVPCVYGGAGGGNTGAFFNFGQRPFAYTAPSGFKALCDTNLPAPVVAKPSGAMDVLLWSGNSTNGRAITGLSFNPDFVWIKRRSSAYSNLLFDSVRGFGGTGWTRQLISDSTAAEDSGTTNTISSFNNDGFTLGVDGGVNSSGQTYVGWCWDAGSSNTTNTSGTITSTVRVNATSGFSIVTYTGTGSAATVGHGLGAKPGFYVVKRRNVADSWNAYHISLGATQYVALNSTSGATTYNGLWNNTEPTSSVFSLLNDVGCNASGGTYVAYCFAPVAGYSAMGSYVGNGSNSGPFVYTGFRPRWLMVKSTGSGAWIMHDTSRNPYNASVMELQANDATSEYNTNTFSAGDRFDILSNGFKSRTSNSYNNSSGQSYLYIAFAESPFQYARAR